jgi:CBS domain-containing protein
VFDFDVLEGSNEGEGDGAERGVVGLSAVRLDVLVTDIPRGPALTLSPETAIATAIETMRRRRRGAAVVVRQHRPIGVVTDRDILNREHDHLDDLRAVPVSSVMSLCTEPLRDTDTVGAALRLMCGHRQWHLPIVCGRGLFLGALDIADVSLWLRDRLTVLSVDACFAEAT